ncbi:MAG: hypothetical protein LBJ36_02405 [Synergistaceae bacterium]|nr:hypothetical protein [Synergistaceae bacterium]
MEDFIKETPVLENFLLVLDKKKMDKKKLDEKKLDEEHFGESGPKSEEEKGEEESIALAGEKLVRSEKLKEGPLDELSGKPLGISVLEEIFEKGPLSNEASAPSTEHVEEPSDTLDLIDAPAEESESRQVFDTPQSENAHASKELFADGIYDPTEFTSIEAMGSLKGFAPLGMLFILMDIFSGKEEGLIRVNRLASAIKIGKPAMLTQLDHLEQAGLIRTVSSSQRGRHVELLVPNPITGGQPEEVPQETDPTQILNTLPSDAPKNFSLEKLKMLQKYLMVRGIRLLSLPDESALDPRLSQIAAFLGRYLTYVQLFYSRLKGTLHTAEEIHFSLQGFQGRDVTYTLTFCKMLKEVGFLAHFTYRRSPHYKIVARLKRTSPAINFLSGGWLEHHIRDRVVAILTTHPSTLETPYAFMKNPKIILPGNENFEFDFLLMVADKVFWIEAKTGEYMDYIAKYARVSKLLGLTRNSSLLVLVNTPKPDVNISARYGLSCCSVDEFPEVFRLALIRELGRSKR